MCNLSRGPRLLDNGRAAIGGTSALQLRVLGERDTSLKIDQEKEIMIRLGADFRLHAFNAAVRGIRRKG